MIRLSALFMELRANSQSDKRIHVILDGAGYHRSHDVKNKAQALNIV